MQPLRRAGPHTRACAHRFRRTLIQTVQALSVLFCRAFSEVDFTIEAAQHHGRRDRSPPHSTPEGTSFLEDERSVLLRLQRNIVVDFAAHRASAHVGRSGIWNDSFNVSAVASQAILTVVPKL